MKDLSLEELRRLVEEQNATIAHMLTKGREREERYAALVTRNKELEGLVERTPLTGLYNKPTFESRVMEFIAQIQKYRAHHEHVRKSDSSGEPHGVFALFDLDEFKFVNDVIGHVAGDEVLIRFAQFLKYRFKHDPKDIIGHIGGDEFVLVLNGVDLETAQMIIERDVRTAIRAVRPSGLDMEQFTERMKRDYVVDTSVGLVAINDPGLTYASLMTLAENQISKFKERRAQFRIGKE